MRLSSLAVIFIFLFLFGCLGPQVSPNAVNLGVKFSWKGIKNCSNHSPLIKVTKIPAGTKFLKVKLVDLDVTSWNHGGGKVEYKGKGIIPAGSLKSAYNGPCPPSGSHRYQFAVHAIDKKGVIIGTGKSVQKFP